ncbi:hypothetical protein [Aquimarina mytili]|uniref:Uncharacterized protein n=1 Tax=Aquimarina mytili TaxID=874423 RepID=A0A936ZYK8_9FLAO|nr:hypothetical protein [Aquimarina mytili]MBL0684270.1 hypothetical protein [Aquimarina mytili]
MSQEHYQTKLEILEALPKDLIKKPDLPIDTAIQEAENRYVWAKQDADILVKQINFDWIGCGEDLIVRAGALRYAQSLWEQERKSIGEAKKLWKEKALIALALRGELLAAFKYAYHNRNDLLSILKTISKGKKNTDVIQDLSDLSTLGANNTKELKVINFDINKLEKAALLSKEMATLLAKANAETLKNSTVKDIRNRAYIHLKEAMDALSRAGKYVFKDNPDRFKGYINQYYKKKR